VHSHFAVVTQRIDERTVWKYFALRTNVAGTYSTDIDPEPLHDRFVIGNTKVLPKHGPYLLFGFDKQGRTIRNLVSQAAHHALTRREILC
jgi:hypothetical protein